MDEKIYGYHSVKLTLENSPNRILKILLLENSHYDIFIAAKKKNIPVEIIANRSDLQKIAPNKNHQGIMAFVKSYVFADLAKIIQLSRNDPEAICVVIDSITDPHNFGAIIRSCVAARVTGIIIGKHNQVGVTSIVEKVSAGASSIIPIARVTNLNQTLEELKKNDYWIAATSLEAKHAYTELPGNRKWALLLGNEQKGVSKKLKENADYLVKIPMLGKVQSLNVSVATGIILYSIRNAQNDFSTRSKNDWKSPN